MARVKMIKPEEADADTRAGLRRRAAMGPDQQFLAGAGAPAGRAGGLDAAERKHPPRQREVRPGLREDPAARHHQDLGAQPSAYCMSHNVPLGRKVGLTEAQIAAAQGSDYMRSPDLDDRQKAAIRWAEAVTRMTARDDEEAFAAMKRHFARSRSSSSRCSAACGTTRTGCARRCTSTSSAPDKRIEFQREIT